MYDVGLVWVDIAIAGSCKFGWCVFLGLFEDRSKLSIGCQEGKRSLYSYHNNIHEDCIIHLGLFYHGYIYIYIHLEISGTEDFQKKVEAGERSADFPPPHGHRIEVTIQYLTILVEPSKLSNLSKNPRRCFGGCFGWCLRDVAGSCTGRMSMADAHWISIVRKSPQRGLTST